MNILFICKHNRFRSKVAEAFFNKYNRKKKIHAKSAGVIRGRYPLDKGQVAIAKKFGINLSGKPKEASSELLDWQDLLIIAADNVPASLFKDYQNKYNKKLVVWKIPDAIGDDYKGIWSTIDKINNKIKKLVKDLK